MRDREEECQEEELDLEVGEVQVDLEVGEEMGEEEDHTMDQALEAFGRIQQYNYMYCTGLTDKRLHLHSSRHKNRLDQTGSRNASYSDHSSKPLLRTYRLYRSHHHYKRNYPRKYILRLHHTRNLLRRCLRVYSQNFRHRSQLYTPIHHRNRVVYRLHRN